MESERASEIHSYAARQMTSVHGLCDDQECALATCPSPRVLGCVRDCRYGSRQKDFARGPPMGYAPYPF